MICKSLAMDQCSAERGHMKRRDFTALLGASAMAVPFAASAQHAPTPTIGFLNSLSPEVWEPFVAAFREGLKETGYAERENVLIDYRWAEKRIDRLPAMAAALVRARVSVIVATGGDASTLAAMQATKSIPIVTNFSGDPVEQRLVATLNRPGGNVTGVSLFAEALVAKRLELLHQLLPKVSTVAFLANPTSSYTTTYQKNFEAAAKELGLQAAIVTAVSAQECEAAFADVVRRGAGAVLVESDPFYLSLREYLVALAARYSLQAIYSRPEYAAAGGLMSYASSVAEAYRQFGIYAGRILKGAKPGDLPVLQPTTFELVINLKTAKTLGIEVPPSLLARANEVIE